MLDTAEPACPAHRTPSDRMFKPCIRHARGHGASSALHPEMKGRLGTGCTGPSTICSRTGTPMTADGRREA